MPNDWSRLADAASYAFTIHANQIRKGAGTPYIAHLMAVSSLVLEYGGNEDQAIAGLLHDAIEDCGIEQEAIIAERYGTGVARIVRACTDADTIPKPPWKARKQAYLAHLETADEEVLLVSCADKLHNARAILSDLQSHGMVVFDRFSVSAAQTIWYYDSLRETFSRRMPGPMALALEKTVWLIRHHSLDHKLDIPPDQA